MEEEPKALRERVLHETDAKSGKMVVRPKAQPMRQPFRMGPCGSATTVGQLRKVLAPAWWKGKGDCHYIHCHRNTKEVEVVKVSQPQKGTYQDLINFPLDGTILMSLEELNPHTQIERLDWNKSQIPFGGRLVSDLPSQLEIANT